VTWHNATLEFPHVATCHASPIGNVESAWHVREWGDAWPPAGPHPFLFLLLPPNFFPAYPSSGLPTPPASSLSPAPPFSPPPTQHSHNSLVLFHSSESSAARSLRLFTLICAPPSIRRPSLALAQLSPVSPAPANTHPPGNCLRPASPSSSTTDSLSSLRAGISPSPVCVQIILLDEQYIYFDFVCYIGLLYLFGF
jgi:hypothetical protein